MYWVPPFGRVEDPMRRIWPERWVLMTAVTLVVVAVSLSVGARFTSPSYASVAPAPEVSAGRANADMLSAAFETAAGRVTPSVVSVRSVRKVAVADNSPLNDLLGDPMFQRFFANPAPRDYIQRGLGTGVVVSDDGYILTNNHVVAGADQVEVQFHDGKSLTAKVVGTDEKTDLAVLHVGEHGLTAATLGDSDSLHVGQWVVAAGNPFGLESTITAGIVSATGRANVGVADYEDFIQTDAAINPGNSGGPLVDLEGRVVGINTAIFSQSGGYMGIGFAIPSNLARSVMSSLIQHGKVVRGWLGMEIQPLNPGLAESFHFTGDGVLVADVVSGGAAERGGLERGDIITRFNRQNVADVPKLRELVAAATPGERVEVVVYRNGQARTLSVEVGEQPGQASVAGTAPANHDLGLALETLTSEQARALKLGGDAAGVRVISVAPMSVAERAGIRPNDVIVAVQSDPVKDVEGFRRAIAAADLKKGVRLDLFTDSARRYVFLQTENPS